MKIKWKFYKRMVWPESVWVFPYESHQCYRNRLSLKKMFSLKKEADLLKQTNLYKFCLLSLIISWCLYLH